MKLYLIHCGFYDKDLLEGVYESHVNFFVAARDFEEARAKAKELPDFKRLHMHVDGMQEIIAVSGHAVRLAEKDEKLEGQTVVMNYRPRGHAPLLSRQPTQTESGAV